MTDGLEFDPGFAPYIMAFQGTVDYLYLDINRFKNFSQKKMKFRQYYKKILEVFNNNLGFFIGCLMWAAYIKTQDEQKILNNSYLGQKFSDEENTAETDFMIRFVELFPKDMKYFMNENFDFDENTKKILSAYREFLVINKGFTNAEKNIDVKLPENINTKNASSYREKIEKVLEKGNLADLLEYRELILK